MKFDSEKFPERAIREAVEQSEPSKFKRVFARRVARRATELYALYEKQHRDKHH